MPEIDTRAGQVMRAEAARQAALIAADFAALDRLLADDLEHVHAGGNADTKAQYFTLLTTMIEMVAIERRDLKVALYGPVAIMTGVMLHHVRIKATGQIVVMEAFGTQIWVETDGAWRLRLYQATEIKPH
jgi:ketosteroid isomerase-like protein